MSDPRLPGDLPPDLPPEYAEAYRRGYERAYQETALAASEEDESDTEDTAADVGVPPPVEDEPEPTVEGARLTGPLFADQLDDPDDGVEPTQVVPLAPEPTSVHSPPASAHATGRPAAEPPPQEAEQHEPIWSGGLADDLVGEPDRHDVEDRRRPGWFVPAILAALVLLLVVGAYGIGRIFSSSVDDAEVSSGEPDEVVLGDGAAEGSGSEEGKPKPQRQRADAYQGRTELAAVGGATATCQAPASVDAAGTQAAYPPANTYDGDLTTAWRCDGDGAGESLTLTLPETTRIGEVGLVPGYAKTDPRSGVDRYAENNRITRVRWTFADGTSYVQKLDGSPANRELQTIRIPLTQSNSAVVEVLATTAGPRNTTAVSEVRVGRAVE